MSASSHRHARGYSLICNMTSFLTFRDHTTGLPTGHYIYLETSFPAKEGMRFPAKECERFPAKEVERFPTKEGERPVTPGYIFGQFLAQLFHRCSTQNTF